MSTLKNVGLIECNPPTGDFQRSPFSNENGFHLKKVMLQHASPEIARMHYPKAEVVQHKAAIIDDATIELIVISGAAQQDMDLVAEALQTGKHVRIV
jgi:predicted dehydrogenase